jgi:hypothetical protein
MNVSLYFHDNDVLPSANVLTTQDGERFLILRVSATCDAYLPGHDLACAVNARAIAAALIAGAEQIEAAMATKEPTVQA